MNAHIHSYDFLQDFLLTQPYIFIYHIQEFVLYSDSY